MLKLSGRGWLIGGAGLLVIILFIAWRAWYGKPVEVWVVEARALTQSVVLTGRVSTESRVVLGSTIVGRVTSVAVREGADVKAGQLIATLEDAELTATLDQADAAWRNADARLSSQRSVIAPVAMQQREQARSNAITSAREFVRQQELFAKGFIGQSRLDESRRVNEVAQSQLAAAEAQAQANATGSELKQAIARVAEARAARELAVSRLAQTRIVAPAAGRVLERFVEPGQILQAGARVASMNLAGPTQLWAQVDEKFLSQLKVGQAAIVVADAFAGQAFLATIQSISPTIDVLRGSVEVKFAVATPPAFLRNDMTLSIEVETARREKALAIPAELVTTGVNPTVMVLESRVAAKRAVKLGIRSSTYVEVRDGLQAGDAVIVDHTIAEGVRVHRGEDAAKKIAPGMGNDATKIPVPEK